MEEVQNVKFQYQMRQYVKPDHPLTKAQEDERRYLWIARKELLDRIRIVWTSVSLFLLSFFSFLLF